MVLFTKLLTVCVFKPLGRILSMVLFTKLLTKSGIKQKEETILSMVLFTKLLTIIENFVEAG